ncbi:MAG: sigma-70 family RNA polymerase sigma factor [Pseudomonadota bacterium]
MSTDSLSTSVGAKDADAQPSTSTAVAEAANAVKPAASDGIAEIYHKTIGPLAAMLRRHLGGGPPDPEDIAQQAYQKLIERPSLDDIVNVEAFLWRTARNLVYNERRVEAVRSRYDYELEHIFFTAEGADPGPERVVKAEAQLNVVREALLAMPERRRRIFLLHRIDGMSVAAAGREVGVGETAARKHIARAMADLDERLSEHRD